MPNYVVTGAPCCGKTTIVNGLAERGYHVVPEAARDVICTEPELRITDPEEFQRKILRLAVKRYREAPENGIVVFDRGLYDQFVYFQLFGLPLDDRELLESVKGCNYRAVFVPERMAFQDDGIRYEDDKTAERIHNMLIGFYQNFGFAVFGVPLLPVRERTDYVEKVIASFSW